MKRIVSKTYALWTAIVALIVLSVVLIVGCVVINQAGVRSKSVIDGNYRRAFYDMSDCASNIEVDLSKVVVSPAKSETLPLLTTLSAQAELAENSLSVLPISYEQTTLTARFFNQVGDWCRSYSRAIALGKDTSTFDEQSVILYERARELNRNIEKIRPVVEKGIYNLDNGVLAPSWYGLNIDGSEQSRSVDYPKLIYDGPFSDSENRGGSALTRLAKISKDKAMQIAQNTLKMTGATLLGKSNGDIPCYQISGFIDGQSAFASISENGGKVVSFDISKSVQSGDISKDKACKIAEKYAEKLGYGKTSAVWYNDAGTVAYVNLAPVICGVVYYPDLIKVKVAKDNGSVIGIEGLGYCQNHKSRSFKAKISASEAKNLVSKRLAIKSVTLAVIPDGQTGEALCYEFNCEKDELDYFVYIDALDGTTRQILRVVNNDQGSLVM